LFGKWWQVICEGVTKESGKRASRNFNNSPSGENTEEITKKRYLKFKIFVTTNVKAL
jgi:hypothetical protein